MATAVGLKRKKNSSVSAGLRLSLVVLAIALVLSFIYLLTRQPPNPTESRNAGIGLLNKGDVRAAATQFENTIASNPKDADSMMKLSYCYQRLGEQGKAIDVLKRAVSVNPKSADAQYMLGMAQSDLGLRIESLKKAVGNNPSWLAARSALADALFLKGRYGEAAVHYRIMLKGFKDKGLSARLAECVRRTGSR